MNNKRGRGGRKRLKRKKEIDGETEGGSDRDDGLERVMVCMLMTNGKRLG